MGTSISVGLFRSAFTCFNKWLLAEVNLTLAFLVSKGVDSLLVGGRTVSDLERCNQNGVPIITRITDPNVKAYSHFVVDGITSRNGIEQLAIKDPKNLQYFSTFYSFIKSFSGDVIVAKMALQTYIPR